MIRSTIKRLVKRALGRTTRPDAAPSPGPKPQTSPPPAPQSERDGDTPWYLDGSTETWGWENTNAKDDTEAE